MGEPHKLSVQRIVDIDSAVSLVMNTNIGGKLSFKLGRLKSRTESVIKIYQKNRDALIKKLGTEKDGEFSIPADSPKMVKFIQENEDLLETIDEIKIPDFVVSEFIDTDTDKEIEISPRFFSLMGEFVVSTDEVETYDPAPSYREITEIELAISFVEKQNFPAKLAAKLGNVKYAASSIVEAVKEMRIELVKKLGTQQENGDYSIDPKDTKANAKYQEQWTKTLDGKPEADFKAPKIFLTDFETKGKDGKMKEMKMPPKFFTLIGGFMEETRPTMKVNKKKKVS